MPDELLSIPGPTPIAREILNAMALPPISHTSPQAAVHISSAIAGLRTIVGNRHGEMYVFPGTGTAAMEMSLVNCLGLDDRLLVVANGYFGNRFAEIAGAHAIPHEVVRPQAGKGVPTQEINRRLAMGGFTAVALTHVETSTGVCSPIEEVGQYARSLGILTVVDGVCATGGIPQDMDAMGIDVLVAGSQKALGMPAGLGLAAFGGEARRRRDARPGVPAYYLDINRWRASMESPPKYFTTHAMNLMMALEVALEIALKEGLPARYARHRRHAAAFRAGIRALGLELLTEPSAAAATVTAVCYPKGVEDDAFRAAMREAGVIVAGGIGEQAGRIFRAGHMGNIRDADVLRILGAVEQALARVGRPVEPGAGVAAAARTLLNGDVSKVA